MAQNNVSGNGSIVEDKWKLALDAAGDGMWDLNMQTGEISFSEKWHEIFGYDPKDVSSWDEWTDKIHPDDKATYKQKVEEYLADKTPFYSVEQRYLCKDGTYKWILSRGVVVSKSSDGKPLRALGTHHDIHARKMAEAALQTSRDTFANAFNHSGIGIALISPDAKWLDVNPVVCTMTGYSREELLQLTHYDITHPDDYEADRGLIKQMLEKQIVTYTIEKRYVRKDKKIIVGLLTTSLVWENEFTPKFFIAQVADITRKKEMESELKQKNIELNVAQIELQHKIEQHEALNNAVINILTGPAVNVITFAEAMQAKPHKRADDIVVAGKKLTQQECIELIIQNGVAIKDILAKVKEGRKQKVL